MGCRNGAEGSNRGHLHLSMLLPYYIDRDIMLLMYVSDISLIKL